MMDTARRPAATTAARVLLLVTAGWQLTAGLSTLVVGLLLGSTALTGVGAAFLIDGGAELARLGERRQATAPTPLAVALRSWVPRQGWTVCLLTAAYLLLDGVVALATRQPATRHPMGFVLMALSVTVLAVVMGERRHHARYAAAAYPETVGITNRSAALALTVFLVQLGHTLLGWWWADPLAGIGIAGLMVTTGHATWRRRALVP